MQEDKVRFLKQCIKRHIVRECPSLRAFGAAVGEDTDIHRGKNACDRLTDASKSDDARRLSAHLDEGFLPIAEVNAPRPFARVHGAVMMPHLRARFKEQGDCILRDVVRPIDRYVHNGDVLRPRICRVHDVVARREYGDGTEVRARIDDGTRERCLVRDGDLRIADALGDQRRLRERGAVIDRQLSERLKGRPTDVPRILRIAVKYHYFHRISSCRRFL